MTLERPTIARFRDAVAEIRHGENDGVLWCAPGDSGEITRVMLSRAPEFGLHIRDLFRLVRALALCTPKNPGRIRNASYVHILYGLKAFRTKYFHDAMHQAAPPRETLKITGQGVVFLEPAMQGKNKQETELLFAQMPRIATLLHFLHYLYGFDVLTASKRVLEVPESGIFWPVTATPLGLPIEETWWEPDDPTKAPVDPKKKPKKKLPPQNADQLANEFRRIAEGDLSIILGSSHVRTQFQSIWHFLHSRRDSSKPGLEAFRQAVTDEAIFDFWRTSALSNDASNSSRQKAAAATPPIVSADDVSDDEPAAEKPNSASRQSEDEGSKADLRRYESAAGAMLRCYRALSVAATEATESTTKIVHSDKEADKEEEEDESKARWMTATWVSPVVLLQSPPCADVKFILITEMERLSHYLDSHRQSNDGEEDDSDEETDLLTIDEETRETSRGAYQVGKLRGVVQKFRTERRYIEIGKSEKKNAALMGTEQFDLRFVKTLLRADVFGSSQSNMARKKKPMAKTAMAAGKNCYADARRDYAAIEDELLNRMLAATYRLGANGALESLQLIRYLAAPGVYAFFSQAAAASAEMEANLNAAYRAGAALPKQVHSFVKETRSEVFSAIYGTDRSNHSPEERGNEPFEAFMRILPQAELEVKDFFLLSAWEDRLVQRLKSVFAENGLLLETEPNRKAIVEFRDACRTAAKENQKQGFKADQYDMLLKAFREGDAGNALVRFREELRRLISKLDRLQDNEIQSLDLAATNDFDKFSEVFRQLYPQAFE